MRKKDWLLCVLAFCLQAVLLTSIFIWYQYSMAHVHLPQEIVLSEEVWNEAFSGKVQISDKKEGKYLAFTTINVRDFNRNGFRSTYYVKSNMQMTRDAFKEMQKLALQEKCIVLADGAYLYNDTWKLRRKGGFYFPQYEYSAQIYYRQGSMYAFIKMTCSDPRVPEFMELLADILSYIHTNTA